MSKEIKHPLIMTASFWLGTHLSIAKYFGGVIFNGAMYIIAGEEDDLVRIDMLMEFVKLKREKFIELVRAKAFPAEYNDQRAKLITVHLFSRAGDIGKLEMLPQVICENGHVRTTLKAYNPPNTSK